jgi:hypothetical protein
MRITSTAFIGFPKIKSGIRRRLSDRYLIDGENAAVQD